MTRRKRIVGYTPHPDQLALWPETSGNTINGLGEPATRRPSPIYWHDPDTLAFGSLQQWFYQHNQHPELDAARERRNQAMAQAVAAVAPKPADLSAQQWTRLVRDGALAGSTDLVGIARFDQAWVFEGHDIPPYDSIIVLGVAMDFDKLNTAPEMTAAAEVVDQYSRGHVAAREVADLIRARGWDAHPHGGPMAGTVNAIPAALACGFGELGKNGSIINRQYGCCFRLATVLTNIPLLYDEVDEFGADDYCSRCQACTRVCPPGAISDDKQLVRGVEKWYVDFDKCLPFFNETAGCGMCLAICPWSIPGKPARLISALLEGKSRRQNDSACESPQASPRSRS